MKLTLLISLLITIAYWGHAQDKASLTKEETVNYINKKLQETVGHYKTAENDGAAKGVKEYCWSHSISLSGDKIKVSRVRSNYTSDKINNAEQVYHQGSNYYLYPCDYYEANLEQEFNPMHIISIELNKKVVSDDPVGSMSLKLQASTAQRKAISTGAQYKFPEGEPGTQLKWEYWGKCYGSKQFEPSISFSNEIYINFLAADIANFEKLKKAFEYLRELSKAEDDPFAN